MTPTSKAPSEASAWLWPAIAQTPKNSAIGASTGSIDGTIISLIAACVRMSTARP